MTVHLSYASLFSVSYTLDTNDYSVTKLGQNFGHRIRIYHDGPSVKVL